MTFKQLFILLFNYFQVYFPITFHIYFDYFTLNLSHYFLKTFKFTFHIKTVNIGSYLARAHAHAPALYAFRRRAATRA